MKIDRSSAHRRILLGALILGTLLALGGGVLFRPGSSRPDILRAQSPTALVRVSPQERTAAQGTVIVADIVVEHAVNLGAYEFELQFSPDVVQYLAVANGPFLGSSSRIVLCLPPDIDIGRVRFGCVTTGTAPGASGSGLLAQVTLAAACAGHSPLVLSEVGLAEPLGAGLPVQPQDGKVTVTGATLCALLTPTPTQAPPTTPPPTPTAVPDGGPARLAKRPAEATLKVCTAIDCVSKGEVALEEVLTGAITSLSPKDMDGDTQPDPQRLGALAFEVRFNQRWMTVAIEPGPLAAGMLCFQIPAEGLVRFGCLTPRKPDDAPTGPGTLALIWVSPSADLVEFLRAQPDAVLTEPILNQGCQLADLQGHPIPVAACDDATLVLRSREGKATPTPTVSPTVTATPTPTVTATMTATATPTATATAPPATATATPTSVTPGPTEIGATATPTRAAEVLPAAPTPGPALPSAGSGPGSGGGFFPLGGLLAGLSVLLLWWAALHWRARGPAPNLPPQAPSSTTPYSCGTSAGASNTSSFLSSLLVGGCLLLLWRTVLRQRD